MSPLDLLLRSSSSFTSLSIPYLASACCFLSKFSFGACSPSASSGVCAPRLHRRQRRRALLTRHSPRKPSEKQRQFLSEATPNIRGYDQKDPRLVSIKHPALINTSLALLSPKNQGYFGHRSKAREACIGARSKQNRTLVNNILPPLLFAFASSC